MDHMDVLDKLRETPELVQSLKEALSKNAAADEVASILAGAGLDAEDVEPLLAEYQRQRAAAIGAQELDDEALDQVAGGYTSVKKWWETHECSNQFATGKYSSGMEVCDVFSYCDDIFVYYW